MATPNVDQSKFLKVDEIHQTRDGSPFKSDHHRDYRRVFLVVTNDGEIGSGYVCGASGIPRPYSVYQDATGTEFDLYAVLVRYSATRKDVEGLYHWLVTCEYSTEVPEYGVPAAGEVEIGRGIGGFQNNPQDEPAVFKWDWEETTYAPPTDLDGRAFVNSAHQPFSPPPTFPVARMILIVERNELDYDRLTASKYAYAVNADVFLGAAEGCAMCMPIRGVRMNRGTIPYFRTTYRIKFGLPKRGNAVQLPFDIPFVVDKVVEDNYEDLQSFQPEILDQGFSQLQQVGPFNQRPVPIFRPGGLTQPVLLDGDGRELKPNGDGKLTPVFRKFRQFQSMFFAPILSGGVF